MTGLQILTGDCRVILPMLEAASVQCCVTSPPYWGLRDYGTNGQLGLESTPEEYIANMVAVFREVGRVLRDDGTLWLNLGDSYAGGNNTRSGSSRSTLTTNNGRGPKQGDKYNADNFGRLINRSFGLKPKDLCMMPARLAMALQADGWYIRSDIIWHKPNPMPESVTDRPTKAHEYIFLLTKAERYFYDAEAIREPQVDPERGNNTGEPNSGHRVNGYENEDLIIRWKPNNDAKRQYNPAGRNKHSVWKIATQPYAEAHFATFPEELPKLCILAGSKPGDTVLDPFAGSGTVGQVALELGRRAILIELNPKYVQLIENRTSVTIGMF